MSLPSGTAKLWYNFLQIAIEQKLPINWEIYRAWGTAVEISATRFNTWWKSRGKALFDAASAPAPITSIVSKTDTAVTVVIPLGIPLDDIKKQVSDIVLSSRTKRRIGKAAVTFTTTGQVNYSTLAQYKRFLEIDFSPKFQGKTIEQKTKALVDQYAKLQEVGKKRRATLRKKGKNAVANKFSNRDPATFDKKALGGVSPKRVSRWRLSAKHLLLNVAEGVFPGSGYYGQRLNERLAERLDKIGLEAIGDVKAAKGGKKKRVRRSAKVGIADFTLGGGVSV